MMGVKIVRVHVSIEKGDIKKGGWKKGEGADTPFCTMHSLFRHGYHLQKNKT